MPFPQPIAIPSHLHGNPDSSPQFPTDVQLRSGQSLAVACPTATRALVALMDMEAVVGGAASHFGGPAAFAEMMSAVHGLMFHEGQNAGKAWHELFHFVNDAGHCENGLYALKANYKVAGLDVEALKGFRSIESGLTGHGENHLFPEGVYISNGPLGSGLPQAQGLAMAEAMSEQPRVTVTAISDGACMEGEARESLAAIPGLAKNGKLGPFVCMISDNNTKLSGRIDEDSFSMSPTFASLEAQGWEMVVVEDGHNLQAVTTAVETAIAESKKTGAKPQLLWMKTIKGKGVQKTEASASGGHGFPLKDTKDIKAFVDEIYGGRALPASIGQWVSELSQYQKAPSVSARIPGERMKVQVGVSSALIAMAEKGLPVISVSADLQGSTGVATFRKKFPDHALEVGVAESNMISTAIGLSKQGYIPVVDTFAQFAVTKGALPLLMSGLSQGPVIGIFSHTGFQDAADGASHQALTYLAMTSALPYTDVYVLSSRDEAHALITQSVEAFAADRKAGKTPRSQIFFLGRENYLGAYGEGVSYKLGAAQIVSDNTENFHHRRVTLLAAGPMLEGALQTQDALSEKGIGSIVVNPSIMNAPDMATISKCLAKTNGNCITIEDHRMVGGMGSQLAHALVTEGIPVKMKSLAIGDHFGRSAYSSKDLYDAYGLGISTMIETAQSLFV